MMIQTTMQIRKIRKWRMILDLIAVLAFLWVGSSFALAQGNGPEQHPAEPGGSSKSFPAVEGWKMSAEIKTFDPENLYDYIDGAAESYLNYDFQELRVAEYLTEGKASLVIEVYAHRTPYHAFGIYSQERPSKGDYLGIGAQGYFDDTILNFLTGRYYVKLSCYDAGARTKEILTVFARKTAEKLGGGSSLPAILNCLPSKSKKQNSEQFVAKNFLGYEFLHSAFKAEYEGSKGSFILFIIEGADPEDCRKMVGRYLEKNKDPQNDLKEGTFKVSDPYHGEVEIIWEGKYIWGALDCADPGSRSMYLKQIREGIKKLP